LNKFKTRTLTGILFVLIVAGALWLGQISFFILFSLIISGSLWEFYTLNNLNNNSPQKWIGLFFALLTFAISFFHSKNVIPATWFLLIFSGFFVFAIAELFNKQANPVNAFLYFIGVIYIAGSLSTANYLVFNKITDNGILYQFELILSIFIIIWLNDTMAYLIGRKTGRHKLMKRISPQKSWEGTLAGLVFSCIISTGLSIFFIPLSIIEAGGLGILIAVAANLGDLFESSLKRKAGKKDSGTLLPGHGGLLDRFDAALFAIPLSFFYLIFFI